MSTKKAFEPWRYNLRKRNYYLGSVAVTGANLALPVVEIGLLPNVILLLILASLAADSHQRARVRRYGQQVEAKHGQIAKDALEADGYAVTLGQRLRNGGDVDLLAVKGGASVVVELKSFRHWGARKRDRARELKAVEQALRQHDSLSTSAAVIWLPLAIPTLWQLLWGYSFGGRGVVIVRGKERHLCRAIRKKTNSLKLTA